MSTSYGWRVLFEVWFMGGVVAASVTDIRHRRVPNRLCIALLLGGLCAAGIQVQESTLLAACLGALLGLVIWLPFWVFGLLGAGDVKFFAAACSWIGPALAWRASLGVALLGGTMAGLVMIYQRGFRSALEFGALSTVTAKSIIENASLETAAPSARSFPYAVPMAIVVVIARYHQRIFP